MQPSSSSSSGDWPIGYLASAHGCRVFGGFNVHQQPTSVRDKQHNSEDFHDPALAQERYTSEGWRLEGVDRLFELLAFGGETCSAKILKTTVWHEANLEWAGGGQASRMLW
jgi:hypothetical protein